MCTVVDAMGFCEVHGLAAGLGMIEGVVIAIVALGITLVAGWIFRDARRRGAKAWPWVVLWLACNLLGLALYLALRPRRKGPPWLG